MITRIGKKISLATLPYLVAWLLRIWFGTCRMRLHNDHYRCEAEERGKPLIGATWHHCIMAVFPIFRKESPAVMVSASNDGDYITKIAELFGFYVVRGSRNRRGGQAAKGLLKQLGQGRDVALVADGSQGPPRIAQPGSIFLASRSGGSILPFLWSASSYIAFNSWDRLILPRPFCRIELFYGESVTVPAGIKSEELEKYRLILEKRLNDVYAAAWQMQGKDEH